MKRTYKSENIACGSCANLIKVSLEESYGKIEINLETSPKELSVNIKDEQQEALFKKDMAELGFEIVSK